MLINRVEFVLPGCEIIYPNLLISAFKD